MRWSERPPVLCSRFPSLQPRRFGPRSLSVAGAHLVLVRSMRRALALILLALAPALRRADADTPVVLRCDDIVSVKISHSNVEITFSGVTAAALLQVISPQQSLTWDCAFQQRAPVPVAVAIRRETPPSYRETFRDVASAKRLAVILADCCGSHQRPVPANGPNQSMQPTAHPRTASHCDN